MISQRPFRPTAACAAIAALVALSTLTGCSEARRALGYDKAPPDEFTVVARAPLSQPPDYELRPPRPGAPRPQEGTERDAAKKLLLGPNAAPSLGDGLSPGEQALLGKAGAAQAKPDIRRLVDEETTHLAQADDSWTDKILFWQTKPPPGEVVDPQKESKRLEQNAALGKPPNEGDTPQIERRQKGWLEDIF